jgi:carbon storage regulator
MPVPVPVPALPPHGVSFGDPGTTPAQYSLAMLIITRHKGQRIVIGHDIEIVISDISRSGVKIGIIAPTTTTILRAEVRDAVEAANREALQSSFVEPAAAQTVTTTDAAPSPSEALAASAER